MTESTSHKVSSSDSTTNQSSSANTIHIDKPLGHTTIATVICGLVGGLLGIMLDLLHRFDGLRGCLLNAYKSEPILMSDPVTISPIWGWVTALFLAVGVAYVVLDSVGKWRRVLIVMIVLTLVISFSPLLMLWDVFWVPPVEVSAILWAWLCAFFYASQHVMPCELGISHKMLRKKNVTKNVGQGELLKPSLEKFSPDQQPDA